MKKALYAIMALLVISQFIPVERDNPPVDSDLDIQLPDSLAGMIQSACYDCHSNETHWPWYSYISPVKFFVVEHVQDGRKHLNFSEWYKLDKEEKQDLKKEISKEVEKGKMPLRYYLWMHAEAELVSSQKRIIENWSKSD